MTSSIEPIHESEPNPPAQAVQALEQDHHLVAVYESAEQAEAARQALVQAGLAQSAHVTHYRQDLEEAAEAGPWGNIHRHIDMPHDDQKMFAQNLARGHTIMVAKIKEADRHVATRVLEARHSFDAEAGDAIARHLADDRRTAAQSANPAAQVPDSARMASILIQRGSNAGQPASSPLSQNPTEQPLVDRPAAVPPVAPLADYAKSGQPRRQAASPSSPRRKAPPQDEPGLIRQAVQSIAALPLPRIQVYKTRHPQGGTE
jgi:hypothetical protein